MKDKKKWIAWTVVILIVSNIATFLLTSIFPVYLPNGKVIIGTNQYENILKYQKLFLIRNELFKYYDGKMDENTMVEGAVKGMTNSLNDPYTVFMNKKEYGEFNSHTEGNYCGVGIQFEAKDNKIIVNSVFDGSPAKEAGIISKDELKKVNGIDVCGKELIKAINLMKGEEGTTVDVILYREGKGEYKTTLTRKKIDIPSVKKEMVDKNVGYIQVFGFNEDTSKEFKKALNDLKHNNMKSLIIDLRENGGGLLNECIDMVSNFVPKGKVVVSTIDKYKNKKEYKSKGGNFEKLPVVVLTDGNTASASEVFLGALKDYGLAKSVGTKTFGKGVVQTILETGEGTALKVTISKYYTPKGININHIGLKADENVEYPKELMGKPYDRSKDTQFKKALDMATKNLNK